MSRDDSSAQSELPLRIKAEAAAWLAILAGPRRSAELEERFGRWLSESEPHRIAWERVSDAWDLSGGLARKIAPPDEAIERTSPRRPLLAFISAFLFLSAAAASAILLARRGIVSTGIGERRAISLPDGSRVTLNTDSRVVVRYDTEARRVRLERGEALFDVRRDPRWPFVVIAGTHEVLALGTAFEVRRYGAERIAITLVEGRISVAPASAGVRPPPREVTVLAHPGQRLTFTSHHAPTLDRPALEQVIAWQSGEVVFDHTPLAEAASEMNRYSERRIVVPDPDVAALEVSGLFQAGDSAQFAAGVAATFGLHVGTEGRRIVLSKGVRAAAARR
jgi:transmembrane sensor